MKKALWLSVGVSLMLIAAACAGETVTETVIVEVTVPGEEITVTETVLVPAETGVVTVLGTWGSEQEQFSAAYQPFVEETGIGVAFEGTRDLPAVLTTRLAAGNPPDLAIIPNPGQMIELQAEGALVDLSTVLDMEYMTANYTPGILETGSVGGTLYGLPFKLDVKSWVWYVPANFEAAGYTVPTTWDEMIALSDQIVADGGTPWCMGFESAAASGWPGTDWIEAIMLRTVGLDTYFQWTNHEIPWTDPAVVAAWEEFGKVTQTEGYVFGGTTGAVSTNFIVAAAPLFTDPPGCYMHSQALFIKGEFPDDAVPVEDYNNFQLPAINPEFGEPSLYAGDIVIMFNNTPNAAAFMNYLATDVPQDIWAATGTGIFPNADPAVYPDPFFGKAGDHVATAAVGAFDGGDLMPSAVGGGTFWSGVMDFVAGESLSSVLDTIETSAVEAYGG
ncbi:MAG: ABC transporter substrate-binding protein [Acidimicrobiia bacterium]